MDSFSVPDLKYFEFKNAEEAKKFQQWLYKVEAQYTKRKGKKNMNVFNPINPQSNTVSGLLGISDDKTDAIIQAIGQSFAKGKKTSSFLTIVQDTIKNAGVTTQAEMQMVMYVIGQQVAIRQLGAESEEKIKELIKTISVLNAYINKHELDIEIKNLSLELSKRGINPTQAKAIEEAATSIAAEERSQNATQTTHSAN